MEDTQVAPAPEQTAQVDQQEIVNDFADEFVDQDGAAEPQKEVKPAPAKTENPVKKEDPKDPLATDFLGDDGKFSADKFAESFAAYKPKPFEQYLPSIVKPEPPKAGEEQLPEWKKELNERKQYENEMRASLFLYESFLTQALQAGNDFDTARRIAQEEIQRRLNEHLQERDYEMRAQRDEKSRKEQMDRVEMERITPIALANRSMVAEEFGGMSKLDMLLTHAELGGGYTMWLFKQQNPEAKFSSDVEYRQAVEKWWVKFAQSPDNIRRIANVGLAMLRQKYFPQVVEHIKAKAGAGKRQPVTAGTRSVQRETPKGQNPVERFLGDGFVDQG
jgi:hypothetical protein